MVYVNTKKYACESCIKGHRSSSCHHADRPLFEIKKKGRPVSQCNKCREARHTRRIHTKCTCDSPGAETSVVPSPSASKNGKRFIPTTPTLPNGLRDVLKISTTRSEDAVDPRQRVDSLLNPCHCKNVWSCKCRPQSDTSIGTSTAAQSHFDDGLAALAHVAASCAPVYTTADFSADLPHPPSFPSSGMARSRSMLHPSYTHGHAKTGVKHYKHLLPATRAVPNDPPIRFGHLIADTSKQAQPEFPVTPSHSTASCHGPVNCGCGYRCVCPGCTLHRGVEDFVSPSASGSGDPRRDCAEDCASCIDHEGGVELPGHKPTTTFLDQFLARAASLPSPVASARTRTGSLDPTNVVVYPPGLLAGSTKPEERSARELAFGLVNVPRLECCGGSCQCPENMCGCGSECHGCCGEDSGCREDSGSSKAHEYRSSSSGHTRNDTGRQSTIISTGHVKSCCS